MWIAMRTVLETSFNTNYAQKKTGTNAMTSSPQSTIDESESVPVVAVAVLSLAAFASATSTRVADSLLPHLSNEFNVTLGDASSAVTFFTLAYGLSQLLFGPLGDRYGKYFVVACACVACTITTAFCAVAPSFELLLLSRLLAGATVGAVVPLGVAWVGDVVPYEQRQPVLAKFIIGQILGVSSGAFFGGFAADMFNWRVPFIGISMFFCLVSIMLLMLNRTLPARARMVRKAEGPAIPRLIGEFREVLARPWARIVLLIIFLEGVFVFGAFAFIASHLHRSFGMSLTAGGSLVMLFGFGGALFAISAGSLVPRMGEHGLARWGGIFVATSFAAIGLAPVWWWAIPACFIAGLGFYMLHNTLQTNATQMAPERRGAAVAAFSCCYFIGQATGVGTAGLMVEYVDTSMVILSGAAGVLIVSFGFSRRLMSRAAA
jgi:predicted MFS family arabinose efflux permease